MASTSSTNLPPISSSSNDHPLQSPSTILSKLPTSTSNRPTPPQLSLIPITTPSHISSLRRLNSLLLPVPYAESFYREILTDADAAAVSRLAWWDGMSVGGIRGKIEDVDSENGDGVRLVRVYIMTLGVLSPFRGVGVGGKLMEWLLSGGDGMGKDGRQWEVVEVYAHVWEANEEALQWYVKRGFMVEEQVLQGYYRKLRPNGAKVVRWRRMGWGEEKK